MIFDRELCSKVLKQALLLLLLVGGNHEQKMFQMEHKMCANKKCSERNKKVREQEVCIKEQKNFVVEQKMLWNECKTFMKMCLNELLWPNKDKVLSSVLH